MNVTVVEREPAHIAYLRHIGPYGPAIGEFWQKVVAPWMEANALMHNRRFGISRDDPSATAPELCRYDAGAEVPPDFTGTGDYHTTVVPGGKYAAAHFSGTGANIEAAWSSLLREWLPASGMQLDSRPSFEYYDETSTFDQRTGVFTCALCIPVAPL